MRVNKAKLIIAKCLLIKGNTTSFSILKQDAEQNRKQNTAKT